MMTQSKKDFQCEFCSKEFARESTLIAHSCVKKMRWMDKDNKNVTIGFIAYKRFYQLTGTGFKKNQEYKDFMNSKFYNEFIQFGQWLNDSYIVKPTAYIDYVIKNNVKLKEWTSPSKYEAYLKSMILNEHPCNALERSITYIEAWSKETGFPIQEFFEKIASNKLVDILRSGKISPWIIFLSSESNTRSVLSRLDSSQYKLLDKLLDANLWGLKVRKHKKDVKEYSELLRSLGI